MISMEEFVGGNLVEQVGQCGYDNLFNDAKVPVVRKSVKIKKSATPLLRGSVLAVAADGYAALVNSAGAEGVKEADCILAMDVDSSQGDVFATAYASGLFNRKALIVTKGDTIDKHEAKLREKGIYIKDNIPMNDKEVK